MAMIIDESSILFNESAYEEFDYTFEYGIMPEMDLEFCAILAVYGITLVAGLIGMSCLFLLLF